MQKIEDFHKKNFPVREPIVKEDANKMQYERLTSLFNKITISNEVFISWLRQAVDKKIPELLTDKGHQAFRKRFMKVNQLGKEQFEYDFGPAPADCEDNSGRYLHNWAQNEEGRWFIGEHKDGLYDGRVIEYQQNGYL